ncbi:hypothetical protein CDCA_CDCA02G0787 [Cyanidium caldarium]|uniref:Glutamine-dependent NAD(+) synthetase n=1 Tax=Cyanidium caldarium TaxID=2771 RepID=A0AAV9IQW6_CYACA|nr:hypothetical protein CDCA_CDCA02G0787 [Cyanidium caldarium]
MRLARVATCNLNQWAMDFTGNLERIRASIQEARRCGAAYRLGPELEVCGYGCEDHFLEQDTFEHSWEVIAELLAGGDTDDLLVDVGAPVLHRHVAYNCRVYLLNGEVLLIRPKQVLADDGNYRESRWFCAWPVDVRRELETYRLPECVRRVARGHQHSCPIGDAMLEVAGVTVASETCEELFTLDAPHIRYALNGCDVVGNGSGSHHNLRKLDQRVDLLRSATAKGGGAYLYANQIGCDGGRLYYDGSALICVNGQVVAQAPQFDLGGEVAVITADVDLDQVLAYRVSIASRGVQASRAPSVPRIALPSASDFRLTLSPQRARHVSPSPPIAVRLHAPEEEIALGPACWLWDYLRRSGLGGFLLPLSGGADSSATAALVGSMCQLVARAARAGNTHVIREARRVVGEPVDPPDGSTGYVPVDARELAGRLLHTAYMGSANSSAATRERAARLAKEIGAYHLDMNIDGVVAALTALFVTVTGKTPRFRAHGGSAAENVALQNIQARLRMVVAFLFAQLLPWVRGRPSAALLVLGSANVDEALRGYLTKYDASSADINPIGGISKRDLKRFLRWAAHHLGYASLAEVVQAAPTAELEPITADYTQTDETDMGMTYDELTLYGRLRKIARCGPLSMFHRLVRLWSDRLSPTQVAAKVQFFFRMYAVNRHKLTVLTPSVHCENYSPEDNRFDLRQFLYRVSWPWQFQRMHAAAEAMEARADAVVVPEGDRDLDSAQ